MEVKTVYFDSISKENTDEVLHITAAPTKELGIRTIVVSSVTAS